MATSSNRRLETFTEDEIAAVIPPSDKVSTHTLGIGLLNLKRLEVGTENSIKVYKVRRFYAT